MNERIVDGVWVDEKENEEEEDDNEVRGVDLQV